MVNCKPTAQCFYPPSPECTASMFLYMLVFMAYHSSRWIPLNQRLKFQIVNAVFIVVVLAPQLYVMGRSKSSRYCRQPLLNNLSASVALSIVASGLSVVFTLLDPVPQGLWAAYHVFGLLSCGHGLCTAILTLTAAACAKTTTELYYLSVALTVASAFSAGRRQAGTTCDKTDPAVPAPSTLDTVHFKEFMRDLIRQQTET
ncbi:uncharacterized protein LOC111605820 isoform X3 [Xiphophorus maculatus]|uniref:uncharacterized protein LOC111605820 isoform X3 n=1 Tax=Xiphophorus maculatus TaxID=8083 RepID=UPI000C6E1DA7|nr:uncharacterized protein LOC111605820 isoform X3 [Xiphophorus maculatus]